MKVSLNFKNDKMVEISLDQVISIEVVDKDTVSVQSGNTTCRLDLKTGRMYISSKEEEPLKTFVNEIQWLINNMPHKTDPDV
jgi:hypothetical protein